MAKYFIINECKGDTFVTAISAATRADALRAAIDDFLSLTKYEQRDGRKVYATEADGADESDFDWDLVTWTGCVNGGWIMEPSLREVYKDLPQEVNYVTARYNEEWDWDNGVEFSSFCDFLKVCALALEEPWHEVAYIDEGDDDTVCVDILDLDALL